MVVRFINILCVFWLLMAGTAGAQPVEWRIGGRVQAGITFHNADFKELPGIPLSDRALPFSDAQGMLYGAGAVAELQTFPWLAFGLHADIQRTGIALTADEGPFPYLANDGVEGEILLRHTIDHSLFTIGTQPVVVLSPWKPVFFRAGLRFAVPVWSSFEQTEELVDASPGLEYLIGNTKRVRASGAALPEAATMENAVEFGVGCDIPLNEAVVLRPDISYRAGLNERVSGISWKTGAVQIGVALLQQFLREKPLQIDTVYRRDTAIQILSGIAEETVQLVGQSVEIEEVETDAAILRTVIVAEQYNQTIVELAPILTATIDVRFVLKDGKETEGVRVSVETVVEKNVVPLLPYVFFEPMSASIPSRYSVLSHPAERFTPELLDRKDILDVYRNLLNIVGQRLQKKPSATLVLTGTNSGEGEERKNTVLSQQRAEAVRRYLVENWGVASERITVRAGNLPQHPSNSSLAGGNEENRRVELLSDDPSILAPIFLQDTVRIANPPIIRFYPDVISDAGVANWQIAISQGERFSKVFADSSELPRYIDWNIEQDKDALVSADAPMQYAFRVRDLAGGVAETGQGSIVFQVQQGSASTGGRSEVTRYSLIVFDYDGADLTRLHRAALAAIRETLPVNANITVVGMTDELGDAEYNRQLSERRAKVIASALQLPAATAIGIGEQAELSSETPEGRFYSRRVDILIRRMNSP